LNQTVIQLARSGEHCKLREGRRREGKGGKRGGEERGGSTVNSISGG